MNLDIAYPKIELDDSQLERLFTLVPVFIVVLAGVGALWLYFSVASLLPQAESVVNIPELKAKASVARDANGIPTIIAESEEDAAILLGYVMAQDRLWQLDYLRRAGDGRLADILGKAYLPRDEVARLVRRSPGLAEDLNHLNPAQSLWLDRFVQGINRFIANHKGKLPVEFSFLDYTPEPFSRSDVNSIICAVAWDSSAAVRVDPLINRIAGKLGLAAISELLPLNPFAPDPVIPSELKGWEPNGLLFDQMTNAPQRGPINGFLGGCGWAVRPDRSASGNAMLCAVVYQELAAPPFWYRARISARDFTLAGAFIPGVPVALAGANQAMGWASVVLPIDDADLYIEHLDAEGECRYYRADGWRKCEKLEEKFTVKGGSTRNKTLLRTETGPIVSEIEKGRAMALRWTGLGGTGLFQCMYHVNRAANGADLRTAASSQVAPVFQIVWVDSSGNIGSQMAGKIPVRSAHSDGIIALPAWTGVNGWLGFVPAQDLPSATNPKQGYLVAGESASKSVLYPFLAGVYGDASARNRRISELLKGGDALDRESLARIALDTYSPWAAQLVPGLLRDLEAVHDLSESESKALTILKEWDFMMSRDSAGAAVFSLWYESFLDALLRKKVGNSFYQDLAGRSRLMALAAQKKLFHSGDAASLDNETQQLIRKSFRAAVAMGRKLLGDEPAKWRWGSLHKVEFQHPLAAHSSFLGALFDVGPVSVGGSWDAVRFSEWTLTPSFRETGGSSLTQLIEMSPTPVLLSSVPLGNSAHFFSSHYKNEVSAW
ncbi:MAG: penicillin acylase family protein, partial [Desulfomonilaceae bacterium]